MNESPQLSRRGFLRVTAAAGGGLLLAFRLPAAARATLASGADSAPADSAPAEFTPNAFVRVAGDGRVTVIVNKAEMGQGISTSLTMVLAEELDADWQRVGFEFAPADLVYAHPGYGIQMTGGSTSTMGMTEPMRRAGATARAMLVSAAAKRLAVPEAELGTSAGVVTHRASGRSLGYGELAASAAELPVPEDVPLKAPRDWQLIGKPTRRLDTPAKVAGTAVFGLDVYVPGMLTALVLHPPVFGGKAKSFEDRAARAVQGVRDVIDVGSGIAVVAEGFWAAKRGRDALVVDWDLGPHAALDSAALHAEYAAKAREPGRVARRDGDTAKALAAASRTLVADYALPYLAHAPMEPLNCVVDWRNDHAEIWAGTQFQTVDQGAAAAVFGIAPEKVTLHTTFLGGGFGRRANPASDYIVEACRIAKRCAAPVKLVWTREDDLRSGYYRPMGHSRIQAGLDERGAIRAWQHSIVCQSILAGTPFEAFLVKDGIDGTSVEGAEDLPYGIENVQVELHTTQLPVPTLWWRSVGHSHTAFVVESFLDEIAAATDQDPLALRRTLLAGKDRHLGVLELAAAKAGWGRALPAGHAHGLAVHFSFNSSVAMVVEASLIDGRPRVHEVTCAVDCGRTINPDTVQAQLEGAVGFALTTALHSAITLREGRVEQSNFHDYRLLRIHEMPKVAVHVVPSELPPTGVGEPGVPPIAPALCNALFKLTGKRIRSLPIRAEDLRR
ncbi:MAG: xanthine dehydrogenase family protein molybdopterin-binding subunit [Planctomycetes bacterium]|nr:xanthine dehydrogenase family protein molybdopterin-binding subunit [Planctomycetota bacterium]